MFTRHQIALGRETHAMGILTPHWLQHLQALFKVTGTEADHDHDGKVQQLHSS